MKFALLAVFVGLATASVIVPSQVHITEDLVASINSQTTSWVASSEQGSFFETATTEEIAALCGAHTDGKVRLPVKADGWSTPVEALPTTFDSRTQWPNCWTCTQIRDQSSCGACWAFAAVEAISDRYSIHKNVNISLSTQDMNSCCGVSCGSGCNGGYPSAAWNYWVHTGLVDQDCSPFSLPSCDHHIPNSTNPCPSTEYATPKCVRTCKNSEDWATAKHKGAKSYDITSGAAAIQQEIYENGPVETAFTVYSDFPAYKSGVYVHTTGSELGGHAVKIIGWGVEDGLDYWLIANSWNVHWGAEGFFKILRGKNECGIENSVSAGIPA